MIEATASSTLPGQARAQQLCVIWIAPPPVFSRPLAYPFLPSLVARDNHFDADGARISAPLKIRKKVLLPRLNHCLRHAPNTNVFALMLFFAPSRFVFGEVPPALQRAWTVVTPNYPSDATSPSTTASDASRWRH
ncbi:hypothetical protein [Methylorubrum populi]|uniref:hypothetical protein n=1 Tax=Methylorubrum populi TaxID=223967 RepID=UPI002F353F9A